MNSLSIFLGLTGGAAVGALFSIYNGSPWNGGHDYNFSLLIAALVGLYIWFPFHFKFKDNREALLHSDFTMYPVPLRGAFDSVYNLLAEANYNFCDKWRIDANPHTREIRAALIFNDEDERFVMGTLLNVGSKITPMQRYLELVVHFEECGSQTEIHSDFIPRVEGPQWMACDSVIDDFHEKMQAKLGSGMFLGKRDRPVLLAAPPVWLLVVTVLVTVLYSYRVLTGFLGAH